MVRMNDSGVKGTRCGTTKTSAPLTAAAAPCGGESKPEEQEGVGLKPSCLRCVSTGYPRNAHLHWNGRVQGGALDHDTQHPPARRGSGLQVGPTATRHWRRRLERSSGKCLWNLSAQVTTLSSSKASNASCWRAAARWKSAKSTWTEEIAGCRSEGRKAESAFMESVVVFF